MEAETDPWEGLLQPDTMLFTEAPNSESQPRARTELLRDLRKRLGWVLDGVRRREETAGKPQEIAESLQ